MNELIKNYIGKECIISCSFESGRVGTITKVEDSWIEIETTQGPEIINIDYIVKIKEYPRNKNGKKKSIVL